MRVFMPREGMPVAALFSEDNKWYRGEIVRILPNTGQIEVFFVDYGNSDIMENTANIRYLLPEYLTLSVFVSSFPYFFSLSLLLFFIEFDYLYLDSSMSAVWNSICEWRKQEKGKIKSRFKYNILYWNWKFNEPK
jgi:hypothetical protein